MENDNKKVSQKDVIRKTISMIFLIIFLLILYYFLIKFKTNLIIIVLIIGFILVTFLGLIFKNRTKNLYSRMFPDKDKRKDQSYRKKEPYKIEGEPEIRKLSDVSLNFKYRKPLINRCMKCGMTLPSYVKKCPICGTPNK